MTKLIKKTLAADSEAMRLSIDDGNVAEIKRLLPISAHVINVLARVSIPLDRSHGGDNAADMARLAGHVHIAGQLDAWALAHAEREALSTQLAVNEGKRECRPSRSL